MPAPVFLYANKFRIPLFSKKKKSYSQSHIILPLNKVFSALCSTDTTAPCQVSTIHLLWSSIVQLISFIKLALSLSPPKHRTAFGIAARADNRSVIRANQYLDMVNHRWPHLMTEGQLQTADGVLWPALRPIAYCRWGPMTEGLKLNLTW